MFWFSKSFNLIAWWNIFFVLLSRHFHLPQCYAAVVFIVSRVLQPAMTIVLFNSEFLLEPLKKILRPECQHGIYSSEQFPKRGHRQVNIQGNPVGNTPSLCYLHHAKSTPHFTSYIRHEIFCSFVRVWRLSEWFCLILFANLDWFGGKLFFF